MIAIESGWILFPSSVRKDKIKYPVSRSDISDRKMTFWVAKDTNQVYQGNYLTALSEITHNKKSTKWQHLLWASRKILGRIIFPAVCYFLYPSNYFKQFCVPFSTTSTTANLAIILWISYMWNPMWSYFSVPAEGIISLAFYFFFYRNLLWLLLSPNCHTQ